MTVTLTHLLDEAQHFADFILRERGEFRPCLLFTEGTKIHFVFVTDNDMSTPALKNRFVLTCILVLIAHGASAAVIGFESWMSSSLDTPPSEAFDRREFVTLLGEGSDGKAERLLPLLRSDNKKYFGLGDAKGISGSVTGRFANFLPPKDAPESIREIARRALVGLGLKVIPLPLKTNLPT